MSIYVTFKGHKIDGTPAQGGTAIKGISEPLTASQVDAMAARLKERFRLADVYVQGWKQLAEEQADGA